MCKNVVWVDTENVSSLCCSPQALLGLPCYLPLPLSSETGLLLQLPGCLFITQSGFRSQLEVAEKCFRAIWCLNSTRHNVVPHQGSMGACTRQSRAVHMPLQEGQWAVD